jgi:protein TonB
MRSASFFILSLVLHLAALAYPASFGSQRSAEIIDVTILPTKNESIGRHGSGRAVAQAGPKPAVRTLPAFEPAPEPTRAPDREPKASADDTAPTTAESSAVSVSAFADSAGSHRSALSGITIDGIYDPGGTGNGAGAGKPDGGLGTGSGTENGYGSGHGSGSPVLELTRASFRHTPPPEYPDAARKDGKEGRVLLRVLVDEEGKSKLVEISLSSGSRLLDQAAAAAIKHWRFFPARYGDSPTASWVKIPVDFRLKETK